MGTRTKGLAIVAIVAVAFVAAGLAYFTATGSGHGTVQVANAQDLTISVASPAGSALYPGGSADVTATVHNPNSDPVDVHSFDLDLTAPSDGISNDKPGCTSGGDTGSSSDSVTFNGPFLNGPSGFAFPPGDSSLTLTNALSMTTSAENACQGATFTVYLQAAD